MLSAALTIPFILGQAVFSVLSGQYISRRKRYGEIIWIAYTFWTFGASLLLLLNRTTPKWEIIVFLLIEGAGVGGVFQPCLIAAQAHSRKADRAVIISLRNFAIALGGALGLALSSAVFSNVLKKSLKLVSPDLPPGYVSEVLASILKVPDLSTLTAIQKNDVLNAYMHASKAVITLWGPIMGVCLTLCVLITDKGLQRAEELQRELEASGSDTGAVTESDLEMQSDKPGVIDVKSARR
jgi:MFS family permease